MSKSVLVNSKVHERPTRLPWPMLTAIAFSAVYCASPVDLIPDLLPIIGMADDMAMLTPGVLMLLGVMQGGLKRPDVSVGRKVIAFMLVVAYVLSPIDLIPDILPVLGSVDDLMAAVVVPAVLGRAPRGEQ